MSTEAARDLVRGALELPALIETIRDDDDLLAAGVNSGELIVVALRCEERIGRALTDAEMGALVSIKAIARILEGEHGAT